MAEQVDETKVEPEVEQTEQAEQAEPENPEVPEVEEVEEAPEQEESEEKPPSRRESLRIQALISKLKEKEAPRTVNRPEGLDYKTALEADDETVKVLDDDRKKYGENLYNQGLEQARTIQFKTRLEIDAPRIEAQYPVLDPRSNKFNPVVADALNQMYLSAVGWDSQSQRVANANVRYADYVESIMELSEEVASERVSNASKNIAKQAATTGLRPSGGTSKRLNLNQPPQNMSDDELKAVIAQAGI